MRGRPLRQLGTRRFEAPDALGRIGQHRDVAQRRGDFFGEGGIRALATGPLEQRAALGFPVRLGACPVDGTRSDGHRTSLGHAAGRWRPDRHLQHHEIVDAAELTDDAEDLAVEQE